MAEEPGRVPAVPPMLGLCVSTLSVLGVMAATGWGLRQDRLLLKTPNTRIMVIIEVKLIYHTISHVKVNSSALAGVAQWVKCQPVNQKVTGSIPVRGPAWVVGQVPG